MCISWRPLFNKISVLAAIFVSTCLYAVPPGPCDPQPQDICCETPEPGPFAFCFPKDLYLACPRDFYVTAQFLIMQTKQGGLDFSQQDVGIGSLGEFPLQGGKVFGFSDNAHDWGWNLGFRIGGGFYLNHDVWSLDVKWTYVRIKQDVSFNVQSGVMLPFWLSPGVNLSEGNTTASSRWRGRFNTFDLGLGKPHHVSRYVVINPFFGIRAAWIEQTLLARYGGILNGSQDGANMNAKNDFWGIGARAGFDSEWILGSGWNLYGKAAASILYGKFNIAQRVPLSTSSYDESHEFYQNTPNFELGMGVSWGEFFGRDQYRVSLKFGYEFHDWWNQNHLRRFYDNTSPSSNDEIQHGDLTMNGFLLEGALDF